LPKKIRDSAGTSSGTELEGWSRLAPAGLEITSLPGDHYSLLRRPQVERLANDLTPRLAAVESAISRR